MGTNYYGRPKPSLEEEAEYTRLASEKNWQELRNALCEHERIHVGKSSAGWKFCFDHNDWQYFGQDKAQVVAFINSLELHNEYGEEVTQEAFWEMVEAKSDLLDVTGYYQKHPDHKTQSYRFEHEDQPDQIYVEDLYFSIYADFS